MTDPRRSRTDSENVADAILFFILLIIFGGAILFLIRWIPNWISLH